MITSPIIPIWLISIICIGLFFLRSKNKHKQIRQIIIIILIFIINLRIMIPSSKTQIVSNNLDVLFVIDSTISMNALDYTGGISRLEAVKNDCSYIISKLSGARFSVLTFSNTSQIITPYTRDSSITQEAIDTLSVIKEYYATGSSLAISKEDIQYLLELSIKKKDRIRVVFFISDGETTEKNNFKSFSNLKKYIDNGAVLGYGTKEGGYMKIKDTYTQEEKYIEDTTQEYPWPKAKSKIDETNLKKISQNLGIDYINMSNKSKIDYKLKQIEQVLDKNINEEEKANYTDIYYLFVLPLVIILGYEFINYKRSI